MVDVTMSMDEYLSLLGGLTQDATLSNRLEETSSREETKKKRSTKYQRKYKANFKKVAPRFKLKSGKWKKNGFRSAVKLAHKMSRK